jgi:hypothetical protein
MPGYIHTCENCGAHMQVHERYLGRNLRCTSCRAEFLAAIPDDVEIVEPPPEIADEDLPQREKRRWKPWLLLLLPVAVLVWWLGQDLSGSAAGGLFKGGRTMGSIAVLSRGSDAPVYVAFDEDGAAKLAQYHERGRIEDVYRDLAAEGGCFEIAPGTSVRVLAGPSGGAVVRVRIVSGPWESRIGWAPRAWLR